MTVKNCSKVEKIKLHTDEETYKKVKYKVENLITKKRENFMKLTLHKKINRLRNFGKS